MAVVSSKVYPSPAPALFNIKRDYLLPDDVDIFLVSKLYNKMPANTLLLFLLQIIVVRFLLNIFCVLTCAIFMHAVDRIDNRSKDLLDVYHIKQQNCSYFDSLTKYFTVNSSIETSSHRGAFNVTPCSPEK